MKKLFYLMAVLFTALTFASCEKNGNNSPSDPSDPSNLSNPSDSSSPIIGYWAMCDEYGAIYNNNTYIIILFESNNVYQMWHIKGDEYLGTFTHVEYRSCLDCGLYTFSNGVASVVSRYPKYGESKISVQTIGEELYLLDSDGVKNYKKVKMEWNPQPIKDKIIGTWKTGYISWFTSEEDWQSRDTDQYKFVFDGERAKVTLAQDNGQGADEYIVSCPISGLTGLLHASLTTKNGKEVHLWISFEDFAAQLYPLGIDDGTYNYNCEKVSNNATIE